MQDILYIHGFLSSPQSAKAQEMLAYAARHPELRLQVPALPVDPAVALDILEDCLKKSAAAQDGIMPGIIGSSLGGFYANVLASKYGLKAVLINPAVHPHKLLAAYVGEQKNYHTGVASQVKPEHFRLLEQLEVSPPQPEKRWVLLETGDETLDYRLAEKFYAGCPMNITDGGSHSYDGFAEKLPAIVKFLNS